MVEPNNPYAAPTHMGETQQTDGMVDLPPADRKKIEAIIKDAGQFWLAILICILCSGIGALIVPIWYSVRLLQWSGFAKRYPQLVETNAIPGSLPARFRSSRWKLIVGLLFGCFIFAMLILYIAMLALFAANS